MKAEAFAKSIDELYERLRALTATKGEEYKRREDNQFANFERGASSLGLTREQVLMVYLSKHLDSIVTYVKDRAAGQEKVYAEPISGRIDDAILYLLLLRGMTIENDEEYGRRVADAIFDGFNGDPDDIEAVHNWQSMHEDMNRSQNFGGLREPVPVQTLGEQTPRYIEGAPPRETYHIECPVDFSAVKPDPIQSAFEQLADQKPTIPRTLEVGGVTTPRRTVTLDPGPVPTVGSPVFVVSRHQPDGVEECHARALPIATSCLSAVDQLHGVRPGGHVVFIHHGNGSDDAMLAEIRDRCHKQGLTHEVIYK